MNNVMDDCWVKVHHGLVFRRRTRDYFAIDKAHDYLSVTIRSDGMAHDQSGKTYALRLLDYSNKRKYSVAYFKLFNIHQNINRSKLEKKGLRGKALYTALDEVMGSKKTLSAISRSLKFYGIDRFKYGEKEGE